MKNPTPTPTTPSSRTNLIGGNHQITQSLWALSLVRKFDQSHAFLVLEGLSEENERITTEIHLVIKEGTNNKKADIIVKPIEVNRLVQLGQGCHSYTWHLTQAKVKELEQLVQKEMEYAQKNMIDYLTVGKAKTAGLFGASLESTGSHVSKEWLESTSTNLVSQSLLRSGHNCYSWARDIVQVVLGRNKVPSHWSKFVVQAPHMTLKGTHDGDVQKEPTTKCVVM